MIISSVNESIVLCLILDSRQNGFSIADNCAVIVLCLILDSRQNQQGMEGH